MKYDFLYITLFILIFTGCSSSTSVSIDNNKQKKNINTLSQKGYYPRNQDIYFTNMISANKDNFCEVINSAKPRTIIELENGNYKNYCPIKNKSYITIKAKNKYGVLYSGDDFFLEFLDNNHHIQIIGIEVSASTEKYDAGLMKTHGYGRYDNHHIYISNCWIHDSGSAILTGPRNHDITVDNCLIHDIKKGYFWYGMGWHLSLTNSILYHPENNGMCIRGHYPLNRFWSFNEAKNVDVREEENLKNLPKNEWTHYIANNFFGEGYGRNAHRSWERGSAISFYQGRGNGDGDDAYLPAQNVVIEDNVFHDITPSIAPNGEVFAGAITIDGETGFEDATKSDIDGMIKGTVIQNNVSDVQLLKSFWQKPDMRLITLKDNIIKSKDDLEHQFFLKIDTLNGMSY